MAADSIFNGVIVAHEQTQAPADLTPPAQLPWFRRLAARLLGRGLSRLQAQHRDSWFLGHATGQRSGHADGLREGFERGRLEGYEAGRQVLVIRDTRPDAPAVPPGPDGRDATVGAGPGTRLICGESTRPAMAFRGIRVDQPNNASVAALISGVASRSSAAARPRRLASPDSAPSVHALAAAAKWSRADDR